MIFCVNYRSRFVPKKRILRNVASVTMDSMQRRAPTAKKIESSLEMLHHVGIGVWNNNGAVMLYPPIEGW